MSWMTVYNWPVLGDPQGRVAIFCTRTYARILRPGLGLVLPGASSYPSALRRGFDKLEQAINTWVDKTKLAA